MSDPSIQRYNLVFAGQLFPGTDREQAKATLAAFFGLKDASAVEGFFSGRPVPLRRDLPQSEALAFYRQLRSDGIICDVVEVPAPEPAPVVDQEPSAPKEPSVEVEPSARKETSAKQEPSAEKEPSAEREPLAKTEPPAKKASPARKAPSTKKRPASKKQSTARKAPAAGSKKAPAARKAPGVKKVPATRKEPAAAERPSAKKESSVAREAGARRAPAADDAPKAESAPAAEKAPAVKKAPPAKRAPSAKKAPVAKKRPAAKKSPAPKKAPAAQKTQPKADTKATASTAAAARRSVETPEAPPKTTTPTLQPKEVSKREAPAAVVSAPPVTVPAPARKPSTARNRSKGPNLFALRPTAAGKHNPRDVESAQIRAMVAMVAALALVIVMTTVVLRFPAAPVGAMPRGPLAADTLPDNGLVLLLPGALLLHERSGLPRERVNAEDLGLKQLAPPLWFDSEGTLFLNGDAGDGRMTLQRCEIAARTCAPFLSEPHDIVALAASYLGDQRYLLSAGGELLLADENGVIQAQTAVFLPAGHPRLLASDGLLLMPANEGPLLGVYRPDRELFGQQLDALLLMPAEAVAANEDLIQDVALGLDYRWSLLASEDGSSSLYRYDRQWGTGTRVPLPARLEAPYLVNWRDKLLVGSAADQRMLRLAADGSPEATFESEMLQALSLEWHEQTRQRGLLRQLGIGLPLLMASICLAASLLYFAQTRALQRLPGQPTALLDPMPAGVHWLEGHSDSARQINRLGLLLVAAALSPAAFFLYSGSLLASGMFAAAIAGSLACWSALREGSGGFLGFVGPHVIAVDHDGQYFYGEQSLLRRWGSWLVLPGVPLPLRMGPVINIDAAEAVQRAPSAARCSSLDLLGMLWRRDHPWIRGLLHLLGGWTLSLLGVIFLAS